MGTIIDNSLILSKIKSYLGLKNDAEFARFLEIKPNTLSNWYSRNTIDYNKIITKCERIDANWLLTGKGNMLKDENSKEISNDRGIPLLPFEAFAGYGESSVQGVSFARIEERYDVPLFYNIHVDFMINVRGSSMYPKYSSGDVVACRIIEELLFVQWNKIYVIDSISQGIIMKRLKKSEIDGYVICRSDNPEYGEFEVPMSDIRKIALVVGSIRLE